MQTKTSVSFISLIIFFLFSFFSGPLHGGGFSPKAQSFTLKNGMTFFVLERNHVPTFTGILAVKVGSADETGPGETGLSHFLEHMAFKGTPIIGSLNYEKEKPLMAQIEAIGEQMVDAYRKKDSQTWKRLTAKLRKLQVQHRQFIKSKAVAELYAGNGGKGLNAGTDSDATRFYISLPSNRLELWFLVESERIKNPVWREFYQEREVVLQEKKMAVDNSPDGKLVTHFLKTAFGNHPYGQPVSGYFKDILTYTVDKARQFYKKHYVPCNMTVAIVGDVKLDEVKKLAATYFGDIPAGNQPPPPPFQPVQKKERRVTVQWKTDTDARLMIGYHIPPYPHKDNTVMELIAIILCHGSSSRLQRELVLEKGEAAYIKTYHNLPGSRYPSLFALFIYPAMGKSPQAVETAIYRQLEKLKQEPLSKEEIRKAVNLYQARLYSGVEDSTVLCDRILENALIYGDLESEEKKLECIGSITAQDIMETAGRIFTVNNRTVAIMDKQLSGDEK